jgi:cephalosporin hydroxylase
MDFAKRNEEFIEIMARDTELADLALQCVAKSFRHEYMYHFTWLGVPIIQFPEDILAVQEIIWETKPELIIETGIARGGSSVFFASMLELLGNDGQVAAVDIDIRAPNRKVIEDHPMSRRITMFEGSSTDESIAARIARMAEGKRVLVCLDSNHTHEHVLRELELYAPLVHEGGYVVVFDTIVEDLPDHFFANRDFTKGNSPSTAIDAFLTADDRFQRDDQRPKKMLVGAIRDGFVRRVKA